MLSHIRLMQAMFPLLLQCHQPLKKPPILQENLILPQALPLRD